jgi:TolB protein
MKADGTQQTRPTHDPAAAAFPAWSPDASRIAFRSERDRNPEIYIINADGTGLTNLTNNPTSDGCPAWSPTP